MSALPSETIAKIVAREIPAPREYRSLTHERQIDFCVRSIAQEVALCDPNAVVRTEQVARDAKGQVVYEKDGSPKIVAQTVLKRDEAGAHWKKMLADVRASYARRLAKSNAEHARDGEDLQRAIKGEFGDRPSPDDRAAVNDFVRQFQAQHGHYIG